MFDEARARDYAEQYVWVKRNLTSTPEICHAAAEAAAEAKSSGGDAQAAARTAVANRRGPGWETQADPEVRRYAEWYDWARVELGASGDDLHKAAKAAVESLRGNMDSGAAADAARRAVAGDGATLMMPGGVPAPPLPQAQPQPPPQPPPPSWPSPPVQGTPGGPPSVPAPSPPPASAPPAYQPPYGGPPPPPAGIYSPQPQAAGRAPYPTFPATAQPYWGGPQTGTDGFAIAALICALIGIPAFFCYGVPGVVVGSAAVIMGLISRNRIKQSGGYKTGSGLATAGWVIGVVDIVLGLAVLVVVIIVVVMSASNTTTGG